MKFTVIMSYVLGILINNKDAFNTSLQDKLIKLTIQKTKNLLINILTKHGINKKDAQVIAEDYLEGELLGKISHGLIAFPSIVEKTKSIKGKGKITKQGPTYAFIDGQGNFGQIIAARARELVIKKAKANGIAMVGINNILAFLRPGSQADKIARKNLIALIFINGGKAMVAPTGGIDPITGTNPIGISIPTTREPIMADMATSTRAWGEVRLAQFFGHLLPKDSYLDKTGKVTQSPNKAYSALAFGGYKGFTLSLLFEILTGSLVNSGMKNEPVNKKLFLTYRKSYRGALFIAIDPAKFTSLKKFKQENSRLLKEIKKSRKLKGVKEILIPGERARRNKEKILKRGYFEINDKLYQKLKELNQ